MKKSPWKTRLVFGLVSLSIIGSLSATIILFIRHDNKSKSQPPQQKNILPEPIDVPFSPPEEIDTTPLIPLAQARHIEQPIEQQIEQPIEEPTIEPIEVVPEIVEPEPVVPKHFPMEVLLPSHMQMRRLVPSTRIRSIEVEREVVEEVVSSEEIYQTQLEAKFEEYKLLATQVPGLLSQTSDKLQVPFLETRPAIQEALQVWDTPDSIANKIADLRRYKTKVEQHNQAVIDIANKTYIFGDIASEQRNNTILRTFDDTSGLQTIANPPMFINGHWYNMTSKYLYKDNEIIYRFGTKTFTNYMVDIDNNWYLWNDKQILKNGQEIFMIGVAPFNLKATIVTIKGEWAATSQEGITTGETEQSLVMRQINRNGSRADRVIQSNLGTPFMIDYEQRIIAQFLSFDDVSLEEDELEKVKVLEYNRNFYFCTPKRIIKNGQIFAQLNDDEASFENFVMDENSGDIYYKINKNNGQHFFKKNEEILIDEQSAEHNFLTIPDQILLIDKSGKWIGTKDQYVIRDGVYYLDAKRESSISHIYELE